MQKILLIFSLLFSICAIAQEDTTEVFDYSKFGDAEGVKRYCTQKVLNQTPQKIISVGYEYHGGFTLPGVKLGPLLPAFQDFQVNQVSALRVQANIPVISTNKIIWQLGTNYWASRYSIENAGSNAFASKLNSNAMTSLGINTTIFKPLNEKNFLIFQASADYNGVFQQFSDVKGKALTISGTAIYGWKTSEKNMIGTGISRTYRAGQLLHIPVFLWNKTFNDRWGMELLLPARGHLRYNFSTSNILQFGFELEGNQFLMNLPNSSNGSVFIQRGELKPRIIWDKKISGFIWLSAQAGLRYNWRFDVMNEYNGKNNNQLYFSSNLGNPLFFNISLNFVSP
ncbi:DUF6268 family outer membrane beta-barrel protein [Sediminibacterium sp.]|uniref:DUF6268 family outer membrane beta-barrel protein n=1 Tax=Sediminibacterium sp. TaxID=1917865 RepID=UPI0027351E2C|nr:DUF6268 family outer membrane beta-barrel protein [Sediminibacterium sp.]MDP3394049.1 DUF6268 family outer membrane beta-barrel protein [Sediminibacterium sp.]MDP3566362.1 DUF6268 family outer membrane beta-barrel protein [Sediminibacterium sp.]